MKIIVGISGGVDSAVTAMLLKQAGYEVEALFMKNWHDEGEDETGCAWEADVEDALSVCERLQIPINTVDLSADYWDKVFTAFLAGYRAGQTPNPDVLCNQEIKFKAFMEQALKLGADRIATGHYARNVTAGGASRLHKSIDTGKDQTYFLCRLDQAQLGRSLFPLGELEKPAVRRLAERAGFRVHDKKDSTGICFIGERPFREFLSRYLPVEKGPIRTPEGETVGEHEGAVFYTIGQRQGLGIGGVRGAAGAPWYVAAKDSAANVLTVVQGEDHPLLYSRGLTASDPHWIAHRPRAPFRCQAKTRYRQPDQPCTIDEITSMGVTVTFNKPQRAVTPGQYVVFYDGDECLGSGVIEDTRTA